MNNTAKETPMGPTAHDKDGSPVVVRLSDIDITDPKFIEMDMACESAYRRGYTQGAHSAIQAVEHKASQAQIDSWLNNLVDWRYPTGGIKSQEMPPHPPSRGGKA